MRGRSTSQSGSPMQIRKKKESDLGQSTPELTRSRTSFSRSASVSSTTRIIFLSELFFTSVPHKSRYLLVLRA